MDKSLAEYLSHFFLDKSVVDLGAGVGRYGQYLLDSGRVKEWHGYDGALNVNAVSEGPVKFMDLTQPDAGDERPCPKSDWVVSLEVAEHIPVQYESAYLRNIRCHATEGAIVSWAKPGQGGNHHVNEKSEEDAVREMSKWGFQPDWDQTYKLRESATFDWFKSTPIVYVVVNR